MPMCARQGDACGLDERGVVCVCVCVRDKAGSTLDNGEIKGRSQGEEIEGTDRRDVVADDRASSRVAMAALDLTTVADRRR